MDDSIHSTGTINELLNTTLPTPDNSKSNIAYITKNYFLRNLYQMFGFYYVEQLSYQNYVQVYLEDDIFSVLSYKA